MKHFLCFFLLLILLVIPATAADNISISNGSYVEVTYENTTVVTPAPVVVRRLPEQGGCVGLGETVDIAGIGWYTGTIAYYGKYYDDYAAGGSDTVARYYPSAQDIEHFYVDPVFFGNYTGYWYVYYKLEEEDATNGISSGNDRLFKVKYSCTPKDMERTDTPPVTLLNASQRDAKRISALSILPEKGVLMADVIISRDVATTINIPDANSRYWMFGTSLSDKFYDLPTANKTINFTKTDTANLPAGSYEIIFISPGKNGVFEELYDQKKYTITSEFRSQEDTPLEGIQSKLAEQYLIERIKKSYDDSYTLWKVDLQDPSIEIVGFDQVQLSDNKTAFLMTGYTNANAGDILTATLDIGNERITGYRSQTAAVINSGGYANYRAWSLSFGIDLSSISPGDHFFTVTSADGAKTIVPFYVFNEPEKHYIPETHLMFVGNNPFVPTPTPEIIIRNESIIVEKIVTVTITIPVTPPQESVDLAYWKAIEGWIIMGTVAIVVAAFCMYMLSVFIRVIRARR